MQQVVCAASGQTFTVPEDDLEFYKKMQVPPPTLCPDERLRRRMASANERNLYKRKCSATGKTIISCYSEDKTVPVYDARHWTSDRWDPFATGRDFDFNRPFFDQFVELRQVAPVPAMQQTPEADENSDYTNHASRNKNAYLVFDSDNNRDCRYSYSIHSCVDTSDCFRCRKLELAYECLDSVNCFDVAYLQNCDNCSSSWFLRNCIGCQNCFGCVNLRNKQYHFMNQPMSPEDYQAKVASLNLHQYSLLKDLRQNFIQFSHQFPHRYMEGIQNENILGNYLNNCKDTFYCFDCPEQWGCKYITQAFEGNKNVMDGVEDGGLELSYEVAYSGYTGFFNRFTSMSLAEKCSYQDYCYFCPQSENCFGCIGLRRAKYCILNKQYSKEEYEAILPKIIEHMTRTKEWGEFFPITTSVFGYNESHAFDYFSVSKEEALAKGWKWKDDDPADYKPQTYTLPDSINDVQDDVVDHILACEVNGKNYKLQKAELSFYRKMKLPIPRRCFDNRHLDRVKLRNPRQLFARQCQQCQQSLQSTYAPDRPEKIVCETCFQQSVN